MLLVDSGTAGVLLQRGIALLRTPVGLGYERCEAEAYSIESAVVSSAELLARHPFGVVGSRVEVHAREPFRKTRLLGEFVVSNLELQYIEQISDEQILAEGSPNWSEYAYRWNQLHPKCPWDLNPLCWVATLSSR